jgi:hypothetical protein
VASPQHLKGCSKAIPHSPTCRYFNNRVIAAHLPSFSPRHSPPLPHHKISCCIAIPESQCNDIHRVPSLLLQVPHHACMLHGVLSSHPTQTARSFNHLNSSPPRPPRPRPPIPPPKHQHPHRTKQPKQGINQIHPNRILHPLHAFIPFRPLLNIHVSKEAEEGDPENEEDRVPDKEEGDA